MIETRMIIERPKSCHDCGNGWYALGHAIDYAVQQGWDVLELSEEQARQQPVFDALDDFDPLFFYGFGHGNSSTYTGQGEPPEIIFDTDNCDKLKGRLVYLLSCETGVSLGPAIIEKGALAYAGFILSWYWIVEDDAGTDGDPYLDLYAHGFYESANELWLSVCDGENFTQAIQRSIDKYNEWIDYWFYENPEAKYSQDCIMYLASNRDSLIGLYNCEGLDEPLCLTAGCNWEQNQCLQPPSMQEPSTGIPILLAISLIAIIGIAFFAVKK